MRSTPRMRNGCLKVTVSRRERMVMHARLSQVKPQPAPAVTTIRALAAAIASTIARRARRGRCVQVAQLLSPLADKPRYWLAGVGSPPSPTRLNGFDRDWGHVCSPPKASQERSMACVGFADRIAPPVMVARFLLLLVGAAAIFNG